MTRHSAGDASAFLELYDALAPSLYGVLLRLTREPALAEDLMQQTFLQMHDARGRFVPGSPVRPWAFAIARRLFIDHTRRAAREVSPGGALHPREPSNGETPEAWHDAHEAAAQVQTALDAMSRSQREAYLLVKVEGLSLADTASILGVTATAVKVRVHRALCVLRAALGNGRDRWQGDEV